MGLSTANVLIQSSYQPHVTIIAEKFSPNTTADLSGGVVFPAVAGKISSTDPRQQEQTLNTSQYLFSTDLRQQEWTINTLQYLFSLLSSPLAERLKISLVSLYEMFDGTREDPWWKDTVLGFRHVGVSEMEMFCPICVYRPIRVWDVPYAYTHMGRPYAYGTTFYPI